MPRLAFRIGEDFFSGWDCNDQRGAVSKLLPPKGTGYRVFEANLDAGCKTRPVVIDDLICLADTSGKVYGFTQQLERRWSYDAGTQVVHSLSHGNGRLIVGDIDGGLHCLRDTDGELLWQRSIENPIYAPASIGDGEVFVADGSGRIHKLMIEDGQPSWSREVAGFAFEACPLLLDGRLFAGAWGGFIYSLDCETGEVLWKNWTAKSHKDIKSRYYGAADCPLIERSGSLYVSDRGWLLGHYSLEGEYLGIIAEDVAAIGGGGPSQAFFAKTLGGRLMRFDGAGELQWEAEVPSGRAPLPPVALAGYVAVLSDTGVLTVVEADTGDRLFQYSISPRLFCLSGLGTNDTDMLIAADMDGLVTCLTLDA